MKKRTLLQSVLVALVCGLVFYILGEPCREFFKVSETTEVRIVAPLPFLFSIVFGLPGALGCAFANVVADASQGFPATIFIPGFFSQVAYGYLPALLWNYLRRDTKNKFKLDRVYKVVQFLLIVIFDSAFISWLVYLNVALNGLPVSVDLWLNVFFNQLITMVVVGIPFMVVCSLRYQHYLRKMDGKMPRTMFSFSLNEKFLLFFLLASIVLGIAVGGANYQILLYKHHLDSLHLWNYVYYAVGIALNIALWASLSFLYYMERTVAQPVETMSAIAKVFGEETEIEAKIASIVSKCQKYVYFTSEIGDLARAFKGMSSELDSYVRNLTTVAAEHEKNHTELTIATAIQVSSLPKLEAFTRLELYAMMDPALEVGGDFYDFFKIDDDHIALLVADVSGKGVPAALFMMVSKIILRHNLKLGLSPAEALQRTNEELSKNNPIEMFVSCLCGVLDLKTGVLKFANAGHERPALMRKGGEFYLPQIKSCFVLGGMPGMKYQDFEVPLAPGDIMFTYTDGVPEAMNENNEEFGNERMLAALNANKNESMENLCKNVREMVRAHAGSAAQFDDITMLAFCYKGA